MDNLQARAIAVLREVAVKLYTEGAKLEEGGSATVTFTKEQLDHAAIAVHNEHIRQEVQSKRAV